MSLLSQGSPTWAMSPVLCTYSVYSNTEALWVSLKLAFCIHILKIVFTSSFPSSCVSCHTEGQKTIMWTTIPQFKQDTFNLSPLGVFGMFFKEEGVPFIKLWTYLVLLPAVAILSWAEFASAVGDTLLSSDMLRCWLFLMGFWSSTSSHSCVNQRWLWLSSAHLTKFWSVWVSAPGPVYGSSCFSPLLHCS